MDKEQIAIVIGEKIRQYRLANGWTQQELGAKIGISKNAIGNYEKGFRSPKKNTMFDLAKAFSISIDDLFPPVQKPYPSDIQTIYDKLEPPRQGKVLTFAERQLKEQNEEETKINEVSEVISLYQVEVVSETAAACGFNYGFGYDDTDRETIEVDERPPRHDIATKVSGDSMQPDYQDGDILYLVDKGLTTYNGDLAVIAYGDRSYFKKIYTENGRLRLVSLNDKYEDITLDFPPAEDTHIKIYAVVGVYRGE
ncbi:S24 family peptidase [Streptococcus mitis]|uniref:XRE family transcriptional regulator n=1 Tax=Streptococcus mitis TaxID=28037 RepID=UPI0039C1CCEA